MYEVGGYILPFACMALLYLMCYPMIVKSVQNIEESDVNEDVELDKKLGDIKLSLIPRFTFGLISQTVALIVITFVQPILSLHLSEFGYGILIIALGFTLPTLFYAAACLIVPFTFNKFDKINVIFWGYIIIAISMVLTGPSTLLFPDDASTTWTFIGLGVLGIGCGMVMIP